VQKIPGPARSALEELSANVPSVEAIIQKLREFRDARDWGQFHDPKNLAIALSIEAAELNELFLWKNDAALSEVNAARVREELADVFAYALLLADHYGFDPTRIVEEKMTKNAVRYPIERARGTAKKYTEL
jgi:NTP pyrophosphatase (non-canonical NTP hydrolase)